MADTTFRNIIPSLKAEDNGDGTASLCTYLMVAPGTGTDLTFTNTFPPLKAVDNGDGTYSLAVVLI